MKRRTALGLGLALSLTALLSARADEYPSRPIRLIIGFPPGSAADISARLVSAAMSQTLGQQIVVESRPGAGSSLAAEAVVRAPADGYTLYLGTGTNATNAAIQTNLRFDFAKDFAPVALISSLPMILGVHPSLGVSSVQELIALAKSKPGELTYASVGPGTAPHLTSELFASRTGIKLIHVPYQGSPPAMTDLLGGRVSLMFGVASTMMPNVRSGAIKGLASSSAQRPNIAPDLPTIAESGLPGFDTSVWFSLVAPVGTPRPIIDKLNAAANAATKSEDVADKLRKAGFDPLTGMSPDEFGRFIVAEMQKWRAAAQAAGLAK